MTRASTVVSHGVLALTVLIAGTSPARSQGVGTPRAVRIRFVSEPARARFEFTFNNQKVTGTTPATKVFTLVDGRQVKVVFKAQGHKDCVTTFSARWPRDTESGALIVEKTEHPLSFSAGAKPPEVTCKLLPAQ